MKISNLLKTVILFCLVFTMQTQAQGYSFPTQETVENWLKELNECKLQIDIIKNKITEIENNTEAENEENGYSVNFYLWLKKAIVNKKVCVTYLRKKLEELREKHPEWFNNPNATITLDKNIKMTPLKMENKIKSLEIIYDNILRRFRILPVLKEK